MDVTSEKDRRMTYPGVIQELQRTADGYIQGHMKNVKDKRRRYLGTMQYSQI